MKSRIPLAGFLSLVLLAFPNPAMADTIYSNLETCLAQFARSANSNAVSHRPRRSEGIEDAAR